MNPMQTIEKLTQRYADAHDKVATIVTHLNDAIELLKRNDLPKLRKAIGVAAEIHDQLKALIQEYPELFTKPRTQTFHGMRLGYMKGKGKIEFDDPDQVVRLIKKHFPDQADILIATTEKPAKEAIANLAVSDLKKIGASVVDGGDIIFIKPVDSAIDKMVDALLKSATDEVAA